MEKFYTIRSGMKVALVGYGKAGRSIVQYLGRCGAELLVSDRRLFEELEDSEKDLLVQYGVKYEGGGHSFGFLRTAELVILSPGIPLEIPEIADISDLGIPVVGELALVAGKFKVPVIAITGTNGKTTVTELIGELLKASGKKVFVGGNIGTPLIEYLNRPEDYEIVVLEVSSFQLESCGAFVPDVAILMNITPDHLDRHKTLERYAAVKMKIFQGDRVGQAIMNGDDRLCRQFKYLSSRDEFAFFGKNSDYAATIKGSGITISTAAGPVVYDLSGSSLATISGCLNSAASLLAVKNFDVDYSTALQALRKFTPGAHRLEVVAVNNGVHYINDSKATNTGAVNIALEHVGDRVILIAGGKDKGDNYQLLREAIRNCVKHMILIGETASIMAADLGDLAPLTFADDMYEAVTAAALLSEPGDTVLLSPACASFDMFTDYTHRGETFVKAVEALGALEYTGNGK